MEEHKIPTLTLTPDLDAAQPAAKEPDLLQKAEVVARVGHARLLPVPADVDHSGADLCRIFRSPLAPVPVRGVRFPGLCGCEMVFHRA